jgi:hypothetical protein
MIRVKKTRTPRLCQGDVIRDVEYVESAIEKSGIIEVSKIIFPFVIVLTQDCDLAQDHRSRHVQQRDTKDHDKWLLSVLVAPLYNLEHVLLGKHLSELDQTMRAIRRKGTEHDYLVTNQRPRYHHLEFPKGVPIPDSVIDFKHYFACNVVYLRSLKRTNFVCSVSTPFREDVSHRFASFLARIGLPEPQDRPAADGVATGT